MQNVNTGYRITFGHSKNIHAFMNTIRANRTGMELLFNDAANQLDVADNNIIFGKAGSPIHAYGIRVEENGLYNNMSNIHGNEINFYQGAQKAFIGILVQAANHIAINDNQIHMHNNRTDMYGVGLAGGSNQVVSCNHIGCNTIDKYSSNPLQAGIITGMGQDHIIKCNQIDSTWNGIFVKGNLTGSATVIETNEFNLHEYAFRIGVTSTLQQPQSYKGNLWFSNALTTNGLNSFHENYLNNAFTNFVEDPPPANHLPFANSQNPPDWFKKFPGLTDQVCIKGLDCNGSAKAGNSSTPQDRDIATDSVSNDPYTDETRWMLKRELYGKIADNPDLLNDSLLNAFYYDMQNSFIAQLKTIDDNKKGIFEVDTALANELQQKELQMQQLKDTLKEKTEILFAAIDSGASTASIEADITILQDSVAKIGAYKDSVLTDAADARAASADDIDADNTALYAATTIETNEQLVNHIYLATIGRNIFAFDANQKATLYSIAIQCPMSGGTAVFRARAMYALVNDSLYYNNSDICNREGIAYKQSASDNKNSNVRLYPIPANEKAVLVYKFEDEVSGNLILMNNVGQQIISYKLSAGSSQFQFSTSDLKPGLYYCKIVSQGATVGNLKLVIIH